MKKTTTQTDTTATPAIMPMAAFKGMDANMLTNLFVTSSTQSRVAYICAAKAFIALVALVQSDKSAKTRLLKAGAKESDIRNGRQLALVYAEFVETGHITEEQFNELRYLDAVNLRRVARELGMETAVSHANNLDEIAHLAETGMTTAQAAAKADRVAKAAVVAPVSAPATAPATTTATEPTPATVTVETAPVVAVTAPATAPGANIVAGPGATETTTAKARKSDKGAEVKRLADALEAAAMEALTSPETTAASIAAIVERVTALARTVVEAAASLEAAAVKAA